MEALKVRTLTHEQKKEGRGTINNFLKVSAQNHQKAQIITATPVNKHTNCCTVYHKTAIIRGTNIILVTMSSINPTQLHLKRATLDANCLIFSNIPVEKY